MEEFIENGRLTVRLNDDFPSESQGIGESIVPKFSIGKKKGVPQALMKSIFLGKLAQYQDYIQVYTDGSKTETKCSCAVVIPSKSLFLSYRLPPNLTIFSAELMAIGFSLQHQTSDVYCLHWFTVSSGLPLTPATPRKKCCHWDWKFC